MMEKYSFKETHEKEAGPNLMLHFSNPSSLMMFWLLLRETSQCHGSK